MKPQPRIVIELAPGPPRGDALAAAAALAERVGAELVGIFIEDMDLLRFAALPFAREVCLATAQRRSFEVPALERSMREHAVEAERIFAEMAARAAARHSFRVTRGLAFRELLAAAVGAATGAAMRDLRLLLLGDGGSPATRWAEQAQLRLGRDPAGTGHAMQLSIVHAANLDQLATVLQQDLPGVVVLQADESLLSQNDLQTLLRETSASVLVLPPPVIARDRR
jgi:hypothetical protein